MTHPDSRQGHKKTRWLSYKEHETGLPSYSQKQLNKLKQKLSGHVQEAGMPGYNDDRMVFMHTYQQYPQIIVHCV